MRLGQDMETASQYGADPAGGITRAAWTPELSDALDLVHELGPETLLEAGRVLEPAGPLGTRRRLEPLLSRSTGRCPASGNERRANTRLTFSEFGSTPEQRRNNHRRRQAGAETRASGICPGPAVAPAVALLASERGAGGIYSGRGCHAGLSFRPRFAVTTRRSEPSVAHTSI